jgi:hypothetical protein
MKSATVACAQSAATYRDHNFPAFEQIGALAVETGQHLRNKKRTNGRPHSSDRNYRQIEKSRINEA